MFWSSLVTLGFQFASFRGHVTHPERGSGCLGFVLASLVTNILFVRNKTAIDAAESRTPLT